MKEVFKVTRVDNKYVYLERDAVACGTCALSGSCSVQKVNEMKIEKKNDLEIFPGDFLIIDMKIRPAFIAFLLYGLPIIFLIIGIGIGTYFDFSDYVSFAIGIVFMSFSFLINYFLDKKFKPEVVDVKHNQGGIM
ncbi:MAG: sigma-E factor negative regulatory protein RseC [Thermosipho sp. (in: thermotogales)]|nr:sigma-E factor negative regulatory protein RseC [Thermosipho sp. (in: thermotogales)]MDN5324380.1 sigma-E factor negative regulatory protein RseC [Thermosipho sp. (in: thermotogales)]